MKVVLLSYPLISLFFLKKKFRVSSYLFKTIRVFERVNENHNQLDVFYSLTKKSFNVFTLYTT